MNEREESRVVVLSDLLSRGNSEMPIENSDDGVLKESAHEEKKCGVSFQFVIVLLQLFQERIVFESNFTLHKKKFKKCQRLQTWIV
jgi:hypothetical protein